MADYQRRQRNTYLLHDRLWDDCRPERIEALALLLVEHTAEQTDVSFDSHDSA